MTRLITLQDAQRNKYRRAWYCNTSKHGLNRVYPYDTYESQTEAPRVALGKTGQAILLSSLNGRLWRDKANYRWAWCFGCQCWVAAVRMTREDILLHYFTRKGVVTRQDDKAEAR